MAIVLDTTSLPTCAAASSSESGGVITIVCRTNTTQGVGPVAYPICIKATGVLGLTPTFKVNTTQAYLNNWPWQSGERGFFSYDLINWTPFGQAAVAVTDAYEITHPSAFTEDVVWFSRTRREGVVAVNAWLTGLVATYPTMIHFLDGESSFDLFTYSDQTNELAATVPGQVVYGFRVSDSSVGAGKRRCLFTAGMHASEELGVSICRAAVDWWCSSAPEAIALRTAFDLVVIMPWNSMGIEGGHTRGQWEVIGVENDANRNMNEASSFEEVMLPRAVLLANLSPGHTPFSLDFHCNLTSNFGYFTSNGVFAPLNNNFGTILQTFHSAASLGATSVSDYDNGFLDAYCGVTFGCPLANTLEFGQGSHTLMSDARILDAAEALGLTLAQMQSTGLFGGVSTGRSSPFARRTL